MEEVSNDVLTLGREENEVANIFIAKGQTGESLVRIILPTGVLFGGLASQTPIYGEGKI